MELQKNDTYAKAYAEILEIINFMGQEYKEKIPSKLLKIFEENRDLNYKYRLDGNNDNQVKNFSNETIGLLAMLELKYWAKDNEKEILNKALIENENEYQKQLREKYNPDNIFKNRTENNNEKTEKNSVVVVEHKKTIFMKFINKIKAIFHIA